MIIGKCFTLLFLGLSLTGCAGKFTLIDRENGEIYGGVTDGGTMSGSGNAILNIDGEEYKGPWIYQASGGSFSFGSFNGNSTAVGTATAYAPRGVSTAQLNANANTNTFGQTSALGLSAVGNGMINARSQSGRFVRCIFTFNTMSNTGVGECARNDGRTYDLSIKR